LCERIEPYTKEQVGIWVYRDIHQFRARTVDYPDPVVYLPEKVFHDLWENKPRNSIHEELRPGGTIYGGVSHLTDDFPQRIAWKKLTKHIAELLENRMLDESTTPVMLQERIWEILLDRPNTRFDQNSKPFIRYWQELGFESSQQIADTPIADLRNSVYELLCKRQSDIPHSMRFSNLSNYQKDCYNQVTELFRLCYWLDALKPICRYLEELELNTESCFERLFEGMRRDNLEPAREIMTRLLPEVVRAYRSLVERNFVEIAEALDLYCASPTQIAVEISSNLRGGLHTDYLTVAYIVLKTACFPQPFQVFSCDDRDSSVTNLPLIPEEGVIAYGGTFGRTSISKNIEGIHIEESETTIYITQFDYKLFTQSQVYQLLTVELEH
jgi:hypothetical protein